MKPITIKISYFYIIIKQMSKFLKPKNFKFAKNYDVSLANHRKSPYCLRLSTQLNIARLKNSSYLDLEIPYIRRSSGRIKNIRLGIIEKKKLSESSGCEITEQSPELEQQSRLSDNRRRSLVEDSYTISKKSRVSQNRSMEKIREINNIHERTETSEEYYENHKRFNPTPYNCFRPN